MLFLGFLSFFSARAEGTFVDGAYYTFNNAKKEAIVTSLARLGSGNSAAYVGDVVIPESVEYQGELYVVTGVDERTFRDCSNLTSVVLPATVTKIGSSAFSKCTGLKTVVIPAAVTSIGGSVFFDCTSLEEVVLPTGLTTISNSAFANCTRLKSVTFPERCATIEESAFYHCDELAEINLPQTLKTIGSKSFSLCNSLTSVTIPNSVTALNDFSFEECKSLKEVHIGKSVIAIKPYTFNKCVNLMDVYFHSEKVPVPVQGSAFYDTPKVRIHVPNASVEAYHSNNICRSFQQMLPIQCATPTVSVLGQELLFSTTTNLNYALVNEKIVYSLDVADLGEGTVTDEEMADFDGLHLTYDVRVKSAAEGCEDSEQVVAQVSWVDFKFVSTDPDDGGTTAIDAPSVQRPVLATSLGGEITLSGLSDGERVAIYDLSGRKLGAISASGGNASFSAASGQVVVVRVGNSSFKVRVN